ncbi:hypothetical protein AB0J86_17285 [Micromonospora sp. NPDC049559]|uniref:hypothetical protein n=1 Tax=Micromonospora sp. NPDC049559 TaxID=3155923 RepID=UPI00341A3F69
MTTNRMRELAELAVPGAAIGAAAGPVAMAMALVVSQPVDWAAAQGLALGLPLALLGGGFGLLLGTGRVRPGVFAPAALYWFLGFPLARLLHEVLAGLLIAGRPAPPADTLGFLAYQAMVSFGFALGFTWLHERFAPRWLHRIRAHNPRADRLYGYYLRHAEAQWQTRENRRRARADRRVVRQPALSRTKGES